MRARFADLATALPALAGVAVLVVWSTDQGGFFARSWYPGALVLLAVLAVSAAVDRGGLRKLPRATQIALAALALFTAWSYLSITWADAKGVAWDGANRTLLYLVVFALFSRSLTSERSLAVVLGSWVAAITLLAVAVLLKLPAMLSGPVIVAPGLGEPFGYSNANAAIWLMALWPALLLAAGRDLPRWARGLSAGAIVVLADTALLSQSRGAVAATAIVLVVLVAVVPGRVRTLLTLLGPAIAVALTAPQVLDAADAAAGEPADLSQLGGVAAPVLLAALACAVVVFAVATAAARRPPSERTTRVVHRGVALAAVALALAGGAVAIAAAGDFSFDDPGVGGARADYYRVALDAFRDHPITGIGADNFAQDYLARDRVGERPTSPHSIELRTLAQTGIVGGALLLAAFAAAFAAAWQAFQRRSGVGRAVAAGGALCCLYWIAHGSVDWFWEYPALGGAAFACLGIAGAATAPRTIPATAAARRPWTGRTLRLAAGAAALLAAATLALPWTADIEVRRARVSWSAFPAAAYRQLDLAARLNPLSEQPGLATGSIAIRRGEVQRAKSGFEEALERDPRNAYATLWLGAIASSRGQRDEADRLLRRALVLAPSDPPTQSAVRQARAGRIDLAALDREIAVFVGQLVQ